MSWEILLKRHEPYMVKRQVWKEADLDYNAGALSIEEKSLTAAPVRVDNTFVIAAVNVVLP